MIWTQWEDLVIPDSLEYLPTNGIAPYAEDLEKITFFVPLYMGAVIADIPRMSSLKVVQSLLAGVEELERVVPKNVILCNAAGVHDESTSELAIGLAIATRRGFAGFVSNQAQGVWRHTRNSALTDSKIAILGYGNIGKMIYKKLRVFEVDAHVFTRSGMNGTGTLANFDRQLSTFDLIILIMPLNADSYHFMNANRLASMKDGSSLINVARGSIIDTEALSAELYSGRISAGIDVTDPEPLPQTHRLWAAPNLIITPHVGGDSAAFEPRGRALVQSQLSRFASGQTLLNIVNRN